MTVPLSSRLPCFCKRCDYDLAATAGPVCPECGRTFSHDDPRSLHHHSRRSWRGRLRRFRWPIALLFLLVMVWPHGWVLIQTRWIDPAAASDVNAQALCIGRPWWYGGYYTPIVWGGSAGPAPATDGVGKYVEISVNTSRARSVLLRRDEFSGGKLAVLGLNESPGYDALLWPKQIEAYVRSVAQTTAAGQTQSDEIVINAPNPPWLDEPKKP